MTRDRRTSSGIDNTVRRRFNWGLMVLMLIHIGCATENQTADTVYAQRCAGCHGETGAGDGPIARSLPNRPASLSSVHWRATVNKDYVRQVIVRGGTHTGISPLMPSNEDLENRPVLLNSLVELVLRLSE